MGEFASQTALAGRWPRTNLRCFGLSALIAFALAGCKHDERADAPPHEIYNQELFDYDCASAHGGPIAPTTQSSPRKRAKPNGPKP